MLALGLAAGACKRLPGSLSVGAQPPAPASKIDEPPPLHTGGLGVLGSSPSAQQGPGPNPGAHGSPVAEGVAAGIGAAVVGKTVVDTAVKCTRPYASADCLAGPGATPTESDAGAPR
jgi:hypothetical protein